VGPQGFQVIGIIDHQEPAAMIKPGVTGSFLQYPCW
jgi:hypothetical protein